MKYKTIVFDYDGTLHESIHIYYPAFMKVYEELVEAGHQPKRDWKVNEVTSFLGMNPKEMWASFIPALSEDVIKVASARVGEEMRARILKGDAKLYPNSIEVLEYLKKEGIKLVYLSNSKTYYMEFHKKNFGLDKYFDYFMVSEMYDYIPKEDILKTVLDDLPKPILVVGDRIHDMNAGILNNLDTCGCLYGYGNPQEFKDATYTISDIKDLIEVIK
ncbi:HAD family hydrolase [Acholeplasma equirhinis]|uniref:HAD family hydrolase n=1 Tax=Acholeplasma equirhinis TaxID=555393 RepID=UPI00197A8280|nr:HAD family hydrolase [Acholeplasma equirhinis]MBN3490707.1 HAD family hydrolase [Acholeplasma equirhinis]